MRYHKALTSVAAVNNPNKTAKPISALDMKLSGNRLPRREVREETGRSAKYADRIALP